MHQGYPHETTQMMRMGRRVGFQFYGSGQQGWGSGWAYGDSTAMQGVDLYSAVAVLRRAPGWHQLAKARTLIFNRTLAIIGV